MAGKKGRSGRRPMRNSRIITIKMPIDLLDRLDQYIDMENMTDRASTIRKIIADHLDSVLGKPS